MKRTMFQLYLTDCDAAIELYKKAFDATVDAIYRDEDSNIIMHAEIRAFGQYIAFSERSTQTIPGNTMQFCFELGEGHEETVRKAYEVLSDGADIDFPLCSCEWSPCVFGLTDKFGARWCVFA